MKIILLDFKTCMLIFNAFVVWLNGPRDSTMKAHWPIEVGQSCKVTGKRVIFYETT